MIELWKNLGIDEIHVDGRTFSTQHLSMSSNRKRNIRGPVVDELRRGMIQWIIDQKEFLEWIQNDMEKFASENNFTIIWTPPYHPEVQPIELVWSDAKRCVRTCFTINRGIKGLIHDVYVGFNGGRCYGKDYVCKGVNDISIRRKIRRAFRYMNLWGKQYHGEDFEMDQYWTEEEASDNSVAEIDGFIDERLENEYPDVDDYQ